MIVKRQQQRAATRNLPHSCSACNSGKKALDEVHTELINKSFLVCSVSNAIKNSEDKDINVLKPDEILYASLDDILS